MGRHKKQSVLKKARKNLIVQPVNEEVRKQKVLPVIAALKSANEDERLSALGAVANLIEDQSILHMLLRERLIKIILANILSDSSLEIVAAGLSILTSVSLSEGRDPSLYMIRENIALALNSYASKLLASLNDLPNLGPPETELFMQLSTQCQSLISALIQAVGHVDGVIECVKLSLAIASLNNLACLSPECVTSAFEVVYYMSEAPDQPLLEAGSMDLIRKLNAIATQSNTWNVRVYGIGTHFNVLLDSPEGNSEDLKVILKSLVDFLIQVPKTELGATRICLELLAIGAQTDDLDVATLLVIEAQPVILHLLDHPVLRIYCVHVLNNIGWSLNGLQQDWSALADGIISNTLRTCFTDIDSSELISVSMELLGSALLQLPCGLEQYPQISELISRVFDAVESLQTQNDPAWEDVARCLIIFLGVIAGGENQSLLQHAGQQEDQQLIDRRIIAIKLNLISSTAKLIFSLLEHSKDTEAHVDALNVLFDLFGDNDASFNDSEYNQPQLNQKLENLKPEIKRSLKSIPKSEPVKRQLAIDALTNLEQFIIYKQS